MGFTLRNSRKSKDFLINGGGGLVRFHLEPLPQNSVVVLTCALRRFSTA